VTAVAQCRDARPGGLATARPEPLDGPLSGGEPRPRRAAPVWQGRPRRL